jgi:diguanylate cyclase (GGDEF)-like protein/PAS domain S-box-containing protein
MSSAAASAATPTRAESICAEQVRHLYRLSMPACLASLLSAVIVVGAVRDVVAGWPLVSWGIAVTAVSAAQYLLYGSFIERNPPAADARRWASYFLIATVASAVLWGVLGSLLYPSRAPSQEFIVMLTIVGLAVLAAFVLAPIPRAFLAFLVPTMIPLVATVYLQGTTHHSVALLLLAFVVVILAAGPRVSAAIQEAIAKQVENDGLLARLSESHAASRQANLQLNEQVHTHRVTVEQLRQASEKLAAMIEASPLAIVASGVDSGIESWNPAAERLLGWKQHEVRGGPAPYYPPDAQGERDDLRRRILSGEMISGLEAVRMRKDGTRVDVSVSAALLHDVGGGPTGYLVMMADITEQKRVRKQQNVIAHITMLLSEAHSVEEAIPRVLETLCDSFGFVYGGRWVLDKQNLLLRCAETWGLPLPDIAGFREHSKGRVERSGKPGGITRRVWATAAPVWVSDIGQDPTFARRAPAVEAGLRSAFGFPLMVGSEFYGLMEFFSREVRPPDEGLIRVAQNVSAHIGQFIARKQAERNLQFVASHDPLTGLFNRAMFSQRLQQALAQAHRHGRRLAVLFIDLDGFKHINDTLGHDAGDVLLSDLAMRLRECMREGDTLGRMGGDEFVVLIEAYKEDTQLLDVARKVVETVAQPFLLHEGRYQVTASVGISAYPQDGGDAAELLKNADIAMYRAKQQGKNNFRFHSPEMNTHLAERVSMESALRRALDRSELTLFFQPRVSVREDEVTGVEALVRWRHPSQGVLNAPQFVPIAEDAGLYSAIGDWVLNAACRQLRLWQEAGFANLRIAVNLSMRQFGQENLMERLREAVHGSGIGPKQLEIEITENILMRHGERAAKLLAQIKDFGAQVVVDDFGTGYSSLGYLRRFPIDTVKIDRSLVAQLPNGTEAAAISRAVVGMAHSLSLEVVAEGVETRAQWEFLQKLGCDAMQGNYYSAPAPEEALTAMLIQQRHGVAGMGNVQPLRPRASRSSAEIPDG